MRTFFIIFFCFVISTAFSQEDSSYYWYHNEKKIVREFTESYFVLVSDTSKFTDKNGLQSFKKVDSLPILYISNYDPCQYWRIMSEYELSQYVNDTNIIYYSPTYKTQHGHPFNVSQLFYVKLNSSSDYPQLVDFANLHNVRIVGQSKDMPLWYIVECSKNSIHNSLLMANIFYESGLFSVSEPDFMSETIDNCVNDTEYSSQWGLDNTINSNVDINFCSAREITTGSSNVIVAVYDYGVKHGLSDLSNIYPLSYNVSNGSIALESIHGTKCASIIGANTNNSLGIAGIAPLSPIMSITKVNIGGDVGNAIKVAGGFAIVLRDLYSRRLEYKDILSANTK